MEAAPKGPRKADAHRLAGRRTPTWKSQTLQMDATVKGFHPHHFRRARKERLWVTEDKPDRNPRWQKAISRVPAAAASIIGAGISWAVRPPGGGFA